MEGTRVSVSLLACAAMLSAAHKFLKERTEAATLDAVDIRNISALFPPNDRLGIISSGKAYNDLRQALQDLGLDETTCQRIGLRDAIGPLDVEQQESGRIGRCGVQRR